MSDSLSCVVWHALPAPILRRYPYPAYGAVEQSLSLSIHADMCALYCPTALRIRTRCILIFCLSLCIRLAYGLPIRLHAHVHRSLVPFTYTTPTTWPLVDLTRVFPCVGTRLPSPSLMRSSWWFEIRRVLLSFFSKKGEDCSFFNFSTFKME